MESHTCIGSLIVNKGIPPNAFFMPQLAGVYIKKAAGSFTGTDRIVNIYVNNQKVSFNML